MSSGDEAKVLVPRWVSWSNGAAAMSLLRPDILVASDGLLFGMDG